MLKYCSLLYIFLAANCLQAIAQKNSQASKTYAVVIGIATYKSKALPVLQYADKDAALFANWLQTKAGGNVPSTQIKLLLNEKATIAAVYDALDWLREHCKKEDIGYVYFSGHGDVETNNTFSLGYLLAYNTPPNNYRNNAIRIEDLNNKANILSLQNKAKVILITDACHSGKLAGDFYKGKQLVASQLRVVLNNEVRLTSCATNEEAAEGPDWGGGRGVFSYYLLRGLNGLADLKKDGTVQLEELNKFLDSSLATDKFLLADKHQQHPVTNGNPYFPLAVIDAATLQQLNVVMAKSNSTPTSLPTGLQAFKAVGIQPIDYFFSISKIQPLENYIHFKGLQSATVAELPLKIIDGRMQYQAQIDKDIDSLGNVGEPYEHYKEQERASMDSLQLLKNQLLKNKSLVNRFNEQFIQLVHEKGQDMINAYLEGDLDELERRQYYYAGNRQYRDFLAMLKLALQIVPANHSLAGLLKVDYYYLSGLVGRLEMATSTSDTNTDRLLESAFANQQMALQLEPYAAYIHNELGNLYLHKKVFDSANYHYDLANTLSPTWSVPWINKIRLNMAINKIGKAKEAIRIADSLQPSLPYTMINAGLVMERENNWLAAESYYKRAIAKNSVHFLPYERLANIYLLTGEYTKADVSFFDAKLRKDAFAINDRYFKFGLELGGPEGYMNPSPRVKPCDWNLITSTKKTWRPYLWLLRAIDGKIPKDSLAYFYSEALQQAPGMPLAHHYFGKQFYRQGNWKLAEAALLKALENFKPEMPIEQKLKQDLYPGENDTANTCLLQSILFYRYDNLEDHYLLAAVYEKLGLPAKAIAQYNIISTMENQRQLSQASYNEDEILQGDISTSMPLNMFTPPVKIGGAIKAARLLVQQKQYLQAEKTLLAQVQLNRQAGDKRQQILLKQQATKTSASAKNYYWLIINEGLESETYNFYQQMLSLFPRDFEWNQKAGLFLYNRLALAFDQLQVSEYVPFYESIEKFAYPWISGELSQHDSNSFHLPGTNEKLEIDMEKYSPVKGALACLNLSVKLSGDVKPAAKTLEALAALNSWVGNNEVAIQQYKALLALQPANAAARNKLINLQLATFDLVGACEQLKAAMQRKQIKQDQIPLLAEYTLLNEDFTETKMVLKNFQPANDTVKNKVMALYARMNWLQGHPEKSLPYLLDSFAVVKVEIDSRDDYNNVDINLNKKNSIIFKPYSIARMYALQKQDDKALEALKQALDAGFNYKLVLDNDTAWATLRNTSTWDALIKNYDFTASYPTKPIEIPKDVTRYKIPDYHE